MAWAGALGWSFVVLVVARFIRLATTISRVDSLDSIFVDIGIAVIISVLLIIPALFLLSYVAALRKTLREELIGMLPRAMAVQHRFWVALLVLLFLLVGIFVCRFLAFELLDV